LVVRGIPAGKKGDIKHGSELDGKEKEKERKRNVYLIEVAWPVVLK